MRKLLKKQLHHLLQSPRLYTNIRGILTFGVRTKPLKEALQLKKGDKILDLACGTGDYSVIFDDFDHDYLGIDINEKYINDARKKFKNTKRVFKVQDILELDINGAKFDKALYIGILHHLSDEENLIILNKLKHLSKKVYVLDWSPGGFNFITNILSKLDRGKFIRNVKKQEELLMKVGKVLTKRNYFVRSGIIRYSLIVCDFE